MSVSETFYDQMKQAFEQHIADLQAQIKQYEDKERQAAAKRFQAHVEKEERFAASKQTLYCDFEDYSAFTVPPGVDLRDKQNVKWWVRYNTLYVELKDGTKYEIEATDNPMLKTPTECRVVDRDGDEEDVVDFNYDFDSSDESDSSSDSEIDG